MLSSLLSLKKLITPANIAYFLALIVGIYIWMTFTIMSRSDIKDLDTEIESLQTNILSKNKTISNKDLKIDNLMIQLEQAFSSLSACEFEKEIQEYESNMGDDYEKVDINTSSDYLPF